MIRRAAHLYRLWLMTLIPALALVSMPAGASNHTPVIYTVAYPLGFFAERLAGERTDVVFPVPADRDPAFWRPSISTIADFQQADLILLSGAGYATWVGNASLPRSARVETSAGLEHRFIEAEGVTHSHGAEGEHSHATVANLLWLDFGLAKAQAEAVHNALNRVLDEPVAGQRWTQLRADLDRLDRLAGELPQDADLIASHPRYQYFARRYELDIRNLNWDPGTPPDAAAWAELDRLLGDHPARVFIWESEPSPEMARGIEERGLTGVVFETGARPPAEGDFITLMEANIEALKEALDQ